MRVKDGLRVRGPTPGPGLLATQWDGANVDKAPANEGRGRLSHARAIPNGPECSSLIKAADGLPGLGGAPSGNVGEDNGGIDLSLFNKGSLPFGTLLLLGLGPERAHLNIPMQEGTGNPNYQGYAR